MPIHFAAARRRNDSVVARALSAPVPAWFANDNARPGAPAAIDNPAMRAALLHFARHGLAAADVARDAAEAAALAGDSAAYGEWFSLCRTLDRRKGAALARRHGDNG